MIYQAMRGVVAACGVAAMLLATPAESKACALLDWLCGGCCGGGAQTTYRAPYVPGTYAPAFAPAAPAACTPQTCRYVPQTCYRTVYRRVPVTTCQAATGWSFWQGGPVTTYRPVTTWVSQATVVPYTTYRLTCSDPCSPCVSGDPCAAGTVISGCPSATCGPASSAVVPYSVPANGAPALNGTAPPKTYEGESESGTEQERLKPIPNPNTSSFPAPKIIDPANRTTSRPVRQTAQFRLIASPPGPVTVYKAPITNVVWRAASD